MDTSDVQNEIIERSFKLARVGIRGSKKPVLIERPSRMMHLTARIDASVDLPSNQKGSHLSRNIEVINEAVESRASIPARSLEELAMDISRSLLDRHEYATNAETEIYADYFLEKSTASGRRSIESYQISGGAMLHRDVEEKGKKKVRVEVQGMTVCPCAIETVREEVSKREDMSGVALQEIPLASHNQRNVTSLALTMPVNCDVEADDMISIVETSLSSPTFEMLKRPDEAEIGRVAHLNPRFVEDVVREVLKGVVQKYRDLPPNVSVEVQSESEESIHKHNAFAHLTATLGELQESSR
jgi:GTP cyclohydrolase-4